MVRRGLITVLVLGVLFAFTGLGYSARAPQIGDLGCILDQGITSNQDFQHEQESQEAYEPRSEQEHPWDGAPSNYDDARYDLNLGIPYKDFIIIWLSSGCSFRFYLDNPISKKTTN